VCIVYKRLIKGTFAGSPTGNSHGPLIVQFRKKIMKLKNVPHFNIFDFLKSHLLGRTSSAVSPTGNIHGPLGIQLRKKLQRINKCRSDQFFGAQHLLLIT
jgi:hypothetical protein